MVEKKGERPVLIMPSLVVGNGKITKLDKLLRDKNTQDGYSQLLKKMKTDPQHVAEVLRNETWKGKTLNDIFSELEKD